VGALRESFPEKNPGLGLTTDKKLLRSTSGQFLPGRNGGGGGGVRKCSGLRTETVSREKGITETQENDVFGLPNKKGKTDATYRELGTDRHAR